VSDNPPTNPAIDPSTLVSESSALYDIFYAFANSKNVPDIASTHAAATKAFQHAAMPSLVAKIAGSILGFIAEIAAGALTGLEQAKAQSGSGFQDLISAGLADLFGTEINISGAGSGEGSGNPRADATATGNAIFNAFISMLGGLSEISPAQGAANAKQFLGFGTNFAVVTAFLGIIGGLVPEIHLDELKLIGEEVHHALGLGRLTHTAITPLVRNLISQPLDLWLKYQLRPDRLPEAQVVRALRAGAMTEDVARQQLAEKGYRDPDIDFLIADLSVKLALSELVLLLNNGDIQVQDAINNLTLSGMPEDQAKLQLRASDLAAARTQQMALLSELETAYVAGYVDQATYNSVLSNLSLGDLEEANFRAKVGFKQEVPRTTVSWGELVTAVVDGIVTFDYSDQWMKNKGYGPQDQQILTYELLGKLKDAADKEKYKAYKAEVLRKAGKPVPPWLLP
jgi:hypothetical protein